MAAIALERVVSLNRKVKYLTLVISILSAFLYALISIGYMYLTISTGVGLAIGIVMAASNLINDAILFYNTLRSKKQNKNNQDNRKKRWATPFAFIAGTCTLFSSASTFIALYTSIILLGAALVASGPAAPLVTVAAISIAMIVAISQLLFFYFQSFECWCRLKGKKLSPDNEPLLEESKSLLQNSEQAFVLEDKESSVKKIKIDPYSFDLLNNSKEKRRYSLPVTQEEFRNAPEISNDFGIIPSTTTARIANL